MTLIAIWSDEPAKHVYVGSDSRLSNGQIHWDNASKIFQVAGLPEVVAYCGVTLPALVAISQTAICLQYTDNLAYSGTSQASQLNARVASACTHLDQIVKNNYPEKWMGQGCTMFFAGYDYRLQKPRVFYVDFTSKGVSCRKENGKDYEQNEVDFSNGPKFFGSGAGIAADYLKMGKDPFDCLESAILDKKVESVGGVPQVYRIQSDPIKPIGFVWDGIPFLGGMQLHHHSEMKNVEWRDKNFNICEYPLSAKAQVQKFMNNWHK